MITALVNQRKTTQSALTTQQTKTKTTQSALTIQQTKTKCDECWCMSALILRWQILYEMGLKSDGLT